MSRARVSGVWRGSPQMRSTERAPGKKRAADSSRARSAPPESRVPRGAEPPRPISASASGSRLWIPRLRRVTPRFRQTSRKPSVAVSGFASTVNSRGEDSGSADSRRSIPVSRRSIPSSPSADGVPRRHRRSARGLCRRWKSDPQCRRGRPRRTRPETAGRFRLPRNRNRSSRRVRGRRERGRRARLLCRAPTESRSGRAARSGRRGGRRPRRNPPAPTSGSRRCLPCRPRRRISRRRRARRGA